MLIMSRLTTEYVHVPVARASGADPTGSAVTMCLMPDGQEPFTGDWQSADWETTSGVFFARLLVTTPAAGLYAMWVRVQLDPEVIVRETGPIRVI